MYDKKYYNKYSGLKRNFRVQFTLNLAEVSGKKPLRILDLGCGVGTYSEAMTKEGHRVVSMDISTEALHLSKGRGVANCVLASATHLPYKSCIFDRILFIDVLEHLKEPTKILSEIYRTLCPEGLLILQTPYPSILGRHLYRWDPTHQKLYTVQEVTELLRSTNFIVTYTTVGSFLPRLYPLNIFLKRFFKTITTMRARK